MKIRIITLLIITLPLFVKAQTFNPSQILMQNSMFPWMSEGPKLPKLETVKPIATLTNIEKAQAKLAREEQKLIKLARKAWDLEDDLKKDQEQLKNLETAPESSNDPDHQKRIEIAKQQIAKSQDKVNKAKAEVESESKKVADLEKAIETAKYTRHD